MALKNAFENLATEQGQEDIVEEISNKDIMIAVKTLLQIIANPSYVDKSANALRNVPQGGTVTTVTTVAGLTNIDGYQGKLLVINDNNNAWASVVRSRIS